MSINIYLNNLIDKVIFLELLYYFFEFGFIYFNLIFFIRLLIPLYNSLYFYHFYVTLIIYVLFIYFHLFLFITHYRLLSHFYSSLPYLKYHLIYYFIYIIFYGIQPNHKLRTAKLNN
jgi:hypothetical protein